MKGFTADLDSYHLVLAAVVVLDSLNLALQKQESLADPDKVFRSHLSRVRTGLTAPRLFCQSPSPTTESESSTGEQDHLRRSPAEEGNQSCKRKRTPVEVQSEEDLDIDGRSALPHLHCVTLYLVHHHEESNVLIEAHPQLFLFTSIRPPAREQDQDHSES